MVKTKGRFLQRTIQWRCLNIGVMGLQSIPPGRERKTPNFHPFPLRCPALDLLNDHGRHQSSQDALVAAKTRLVWGAPSAWFRLQQSISWIMELLQEPPKKWNLKPIPYRFPHDGCPIEKIRNHLHQIPGDGSESILATTYHTMCPIGE